MESEDVHVHIDDDLKSPLFIDVNATIHKKTRPL
jgi:hypothetical protein